MARVVDYPLEVYKGLVFGHHPRTSSAAPSDGGDQDDPEMVDSEIDTDSGVTDSEPS